MVIMITIKKVKASKITVQSLQNITTTSMLVIKIKIYKIYYLIYIKYIYIYKNVMIHFLTWKFGGQPMKNNMATGMIE